jgi:alanine racemase
VSRASRRSSHEVPLSTVTVRVDASAIAANARFAIHRAGGAGLIAVVKDGAYGHGAVRAARALAGVAGAFAVAGPGQGMELRAGGVRKPIILLTPLLGAEWPRALKAGLTPCVLSSEDLYRAPVRGGTLEAHLKFDTGMGRLGFQPEAARTVAAMLARRGVRRLAGVMTHLSCGREGVYTRSQLDAFDACLSALRERAIRYGMVHVASTEGVLNSPRACAYGWIRPGLMLYGCGPGPRPVAGLKPALSWRARVAAVRRVPKGAPVSYGHTWRAPRAAKLGVIAAGYAHGLFRSLGNRGVALVRGRRVPFRGRVCMDLTVVDLSGVPGARPGDEALLVGRQGGSRISAEEVAARAGTIAYEVLCAAGGLNGGVGS